MLQTQERGIQDERWIQYSIIMTFCEGKVHTVVASAFGVFVETGKGNTQHLVMFSLVSAVSSVVSVLVMGRQ